MSHYLQSVRPLSSWDEMAVNVILLKNLTKSVLKDLQYSLANTDLTAPEPVWIRQKSLKVHGKYVLGGKKYSNCCFSLRKKKPRTLELSYYKNNFVHSKLWVQSKSTVTSIRETSISPKTGLTRQYVILMPMKECLNIFEHHHAEKWWSQDLLKLENLVMPIKRGRPKGKS